MCRIVHARISQKTNLDQSRHRSEAIGSQSKGDNKMTDNAQFNAGEGMAALGICESLLLALTDLKIITEEDARDLLADVVTTHNEASTASLTPEKNLAVVAIVEHPR